MTERWWNDAREDAVHVAAAEWFARLQDSEVTLEETLEWQRWFRADQRHAEAFTRIEEAWEALRDVSPQRVHASSRWRPLRGRPLAVAACLLVGITIAGAILWDRSSFASRETFTTQVGENRTVSLSDGSQITLGGDSSLAVSFTDDQRNLTLSRGEAFFTVARDLSRPFRVRAGNATVVAVGTQFNVRVGEERVLVAVVEGRVRVEPSPPLASIPVTWLQELALNEEGAAPKPKRVQLEAGREMVVGKQGQLGAPLEIADVSGAAAWRDGLLSFQREPLRYVVDDVNRYAAKPIVLGDETIGDILITGTVVGNNAGEWVESLESALGLEATEEAERVVVRRR